MICKDIAEFDAIPGIQLEWPDKNNFMVFNCWITPTEGLYKGAKYEWEITIPQSYPHSPPKCLLKTLPVRSNSFLFFFGYFYFFDK